MKKTVLIAFITTSLVVACKNGKDGKNNTTGTEKDKKTVVVQPAAADLQQTKDELEKMTPLTTDAMTALVPMEINGAARENLDINNAMGALVANANYQLNDSVRLRLEIVDCAGPGGAGLFGMQYMNMLGMDTDNDDEYVKTVDFQGGKAFENCKKKSNRCTLAYFSGNRYLVSVEAAHIGISGLREIAGNLKIK